MQDAPSEIGLTKHSDSLCSGRIIEYSELVITLVLCVLFEPNSVSRIQNSLACVHCTADIYLRMILPFGILIAHLRWPRKRAGILI